MYQGIKLVLRDVDLGLGLAEERDDSLSRMSTDDRDGGLGRVFLARNFFYKSLSADHIECRHTKKTLGVENTGLLHDLGGNGHG